MTNSRFRSADALRMSVSLALAAGMTAAVPTAFAQDDEATATEGRVEVTGSRIRRADIEGALPVTVIDRAQIEMSGQISVAELLRNTTFNSFGSFRPRSGSSAQSFAGLSLRGLGEERTLILVDGRRAPISPQAGAGQDLNSIPVAAVERIEILSDGASAIYGTDAIGGVINIITRKDFNGVEMMVGMGRPKRLGGDTDEGSIIFGASSPDARVIAGASYSNRGIVFQRDRPWSAGGVSSYSNNFRVANPNAASATPGGDPTDPADWSFGGFLAHPTNGSVVPGGCEDPGFSIIQVSGNPFCAYDFTFVAADEASIHNQALFTRASFRINDDWETYMNASVNRVKSFGRYAPVPSSPWPGGQPFLPVGSPNHPGNPTGNNAGNTAGYDPTVPYFFSHRFAALGPRDDTVDGHVYDIQAGFQGRVGTIDLDFGIRNSESKSIDLERNYVVGTIAQEAISSGAYNIYDPSGNDPDVLGSLISTNSREARFEQKEIYAIASMDMFEMDGGIAGTAFGIEYREEVYADIYDSLQSSGQIVGAAGNSAGGDRDLTAVFFEVLLPVIPDLEIGLAGRYDKYSDYGSDFSPKISARWQPTDTLTLRASYGQGFRAPTLDIITQQPAFGAATVTHPATCDAQGGGAPCNIQISTFTIANPDLSSEQSTQFALGGAWDATDWLNMSLDYYNIEVEDQVFFIGATQIWQCIEGVTQNCPAGLTDFTDDPFQPPDSSRGLGLIYGPDGEIQFAQLGFANFGSIETDGFDINGRTRFNFSGLGRLESNLQLSYVNSFKVNGNEIIEDRGQPQMRAMLSNAWSYGDYQVVLLTRFIGAQPDALAVDPDDNIIPDPLPSHTTHDFQVNYYTPWNGRMTFGILNVADKDPVVDDNDLSGRGFNFNLYSPNGRVPYIRYTQTF